MQTPKAMKLKPADGTCDFPTLNNGNLQKAYESRRRRSFCTNYTIIPFLMTCWAPHGGGKDR